ncbi:MAG: 50S ribosomal protein L11 methyltransferase [Planctomycetota bacterium]
MEHTRSNNPRHDRGVTWVLDLAVSADVLVPDGCGAGRDAFIEWLWGTLGECGLAGVFEGTVDAAAAAAAGLIESPRVLDAAESPAGRDWVAALPAATLACWFTDELAARHAAVGLAGVPGCDVLAVRTEGDNADEASWRQSFAAIAVPGFGRVCPAWDEGESCASSHGSTIFIEPGAGFGTGLHETTQLCLAAIAGWAGQGGRLDRVLDFGSGSGILGIAAAVCGAADVHAVEIDRRVHDAIRGNATRNGVIDRVVVMSELPANAEPHDLVVANIVADVLLQHAGPLAAAVRRNPAGGLAGGVVLSGLLEEDVVRVAHVFTGLLGGPPVVTRRGEWRCLTFSPSTMANHGEPPCL